MEYLPVFYLLALLFIGYRIEKLHNLMAEWKSDWDEVHGLAEERRRAIQEKYEEDELYENAKEVVVKAGSASTSLLQRKLGIGYSRAAHLLDRLEEEGVIGPGEGSKPREVLQ
jgi:DNA segregation ATPase FtsK/SpoIIIE-like protein